DMMQQFKNLGGEIRQGVVNKVYKVDKVFKVEMDDGKVVETKAVIVATGAGAKWLGLPQEKELIGRGISGCATCDGMFFKDKIVAVVGGGDVACEDAEFLTKFAKKVYLIHRRDTLRAQVAQQKLVLENEKIEKVWNSEVIEINSNFENNNFQTNDKLENIKIKNNLTGEEKVLPVDGLFVAIGRIPATDFLKGVVELKESGQVITKLNSEFPTMTSKPGIFAAGDCVEENHRQAIVAAGDGCRAGLEAERWIKELSYN
ncbi:MAG TPA: FAD-dependent oxidoreductase, partial [Candidatus Woesebacteria bacterium]|nr:FAD-dependent oxidoreductase [Candidatus Woesebacteria bacterium]